MKILIKFILLSFVLFLSSGSYAVSGKQLFVPIFGDITVFVPIISAPTSVNANLTTSTVGEEIYDISWSAVSAAAYYQLVVTSESGEKSYFETSLLNYRMSGVPLGNNKVEILACNSSNQCGASSLVGNFNSRLKVTYSHADVLGSPIVETDQSGKVVNEYHYKPFGDTKENKKEAIGYTGHLEDPDIQLTYMQARYYDPVLGRFYGNDPVAYRDTHSFNRYAYANNNPYKYVDPDGELPILIPLLAIFGTGSALTYSDYANAPGPNDEIHVKDPLEKAFATAGVPLATTSIKTVVSTKTVVTNVRDLHAEAEAARDALVNELKELKHPPATVVGGYSPSTGRVAAGASRGGGRGCAENSCAEALGNPPDIQFTTAVRPRTEQNVPVCTNCESKYGRKAFPDPETKYQSDEVKPK